MILLAFTAGPPLYAPHKLYTSWSPSGSVALKSSVNGRSKQATEMPWLNRGLKSVMPGPSRFKPGISVVYVAPTELPTFMILSILQQV
ncbi:MAG TPA: hypothetical protein DCQ34_07935 [Chitinophagaceae bacterium]|nr:hypothetical protein [Chitinophagaceae bacterium]